MLRDANANVRGHDISLVIPTLNASAEIATLLDLVLDQIVVPSEILVVDSSSDDNTVGVINERFPTVMVRVVKRADFNHGLTRDFALRQVSGEIVCFMTQDAVPASKDYFARLVRPLYEDASVGLSSGRQLPKLDARRFEQLVRNYNYREESCVYSIEDLSRAGIRTFFASDVCSAYRRRAYLECGGFAETDISEDMYMAAKMIYGGWKVAYAADAEVCHSHNLTARQQYARNYKIGRFLETHDDLFGAVKEIGEGKDLVASVSKSLVAEKRYIELVAFFGDVAARLMGNRMGRWRARNHG